MKQNLNILFLSSWYPSRVASTKGNFVQRHAEAVATKANVVAVAVEEDPSLSDLFEVVEENIRGVWTIWVYFKSSDLPAIGKVQKWKRYFKAYKLGIKRAEEQLTFDVVHGHVFWPVGMIARKYAKAKNIPLVFTEHLTAYLPQNRHRLEEKHLRSIRKSAKQTQRILPVSQDLLQAMQELKIEGKYEVVPNVVNTEWFYPVQHAPEKKELLHVSTAKDEHKNISGILRAIRQLKEEGKIIPLRIVSDGEIAPHKQYAAQLQLNDCVRFEGKKTPEQIADCMRESAAFVLFSNYENLPCVICEALSCGIPVVATHVGGIPEMLDPSNGILIHPKDETALKQALVKVLESGRYRAEEIARSAQERYSIAAVSQQLMDVYREVIEKN